MTDYCSILARQAHEPLIGTAARNACHFVMACPKNEWLARPEEMDGESGEFARLVEPLKDQALFSLKHSSERGTLWLFPHGLRFDNLSPSDYPKLIEAALNGEIIFPHTPLPPDPIFMVCTHGKRDISCAKFGREVLSELAQHLPTEQIWESSHIGGHRFAGTLIVQPLNQWYGFLTPADVPALLEALRQKRVLASHYRGNAHYPPPLQAAELWAWEQLGENKGEIYLFNPRLVDKTLWVEVGIATANHMERHALTLVGEPYTFIADSQSDKTKDRLIWRVTDHANAPQP